MLMHGGEDGKSEVSIERDKESVSLILSIFQGIKCSEDAFDPAKSKVVIKHFSPYSLW